MRKQHEDDLRLSIPSVLSAVELVCEQIRGTLEKHHLEPMRFQVELVARECLNNAILHGNRGQQNRVVDFGMRVGRKRICLRTVDQGAGFDWRLRQQCWPIDSVCSGRGLLLAGAYAERIAFNSRGNQVTVWISTGQKERLQENVELSHGT